MNRVEKIMKELSDGQAALITSEVSRQYLTGFHSSAGVVIVVKDSAYFLIDSRYYEKAKEAVKSCHVILLKELSDHANEIFQKHKIKKVSVESHAITVQELTEYIERFPTLEFDSTEWLSENLVNQRIIKTDEELKYMKIAQRIAEKAFNKLLSKMHVGMTEKQVAALLNYFLHGYGADEISFATIAASGKNSACPHATPTDKPIENGEFLTLDFGATYCGYHSDMTRTISIGEPTDEMRKIYNAVLGANIDSMKAVKAGVSAKLVDSVARSTLEAYSLDQYFGHGLGHGVGLEIHEAPRLSQKSDYMLKEDMVVTIEPGVYLPGEFGVRIEDMVVVTKNGCINLTKTPKSLMWI